MSKHFTLDTLNESADKQYGRMIVEFGDGKSVTFRNLLRVKDFERAQFIALSESMKEGAAQVETMSEMLTVVASRKEEAESFLEQVGDDLGLLATVFQKYTAETESGEASGSQA